MVVAFTGMLALTFISKTRGTSALLQGFALPTLGPPLILSDLKGHSPPNSHG